LAALLHHSKVLLLTKALVAQQVLVLVVRLQAVMLTFLVALVVQAKALAVAVRQVTRPMVLLALLVAVLEVILPVLVVAV
jgi:hypothetical protein